MSRQGGAASDCGSPSTDMANNLPPSSSSSCSSPAAATSPQLQLYQTIIFATPVLFSFFLLILFCLLCIKRRRDAVNIQNAAHPNTARHSFHPLFHHQQGLSKSFRQMLPVIPFDEKLAASSEHNQCAVCLGEYQLNEKLQQLPVCKHLFHVQCIDEWLAKNTTCPICRISLAQDALIVHKNPAEAFDDPLRPMGHHLNRRWEERVAAANMAMASSEHNSGMRLSSDGIDRGRADVASSSGTSTIAPSPPRFSAEHSIDIERS